jgi:DNA ligase (NAD+)
MNLNTLFTETFGSDISDTTKNYIEELVIKITEANIAYREGDAIISDMEFDEMMDELAQLDPTNPLLFEIGYISENDERKSKLPTKMFSMNKEKLLVDIIKWVRSKQSVIKQVYSDINNVELCISAKYDGLAFCTENSKLGWTRGNGEYGQTSDKHYHKILETQKTNYFPYDTFGEVIMRKDIFKEKYNHKYKTPRNFVAGLLVNKEATEPLLDADYIRYGMFNYDYEKNGISHKGEIFNLLNSHQKTPVNYTVLTLGELEGKGEEYLISLYEEWSKDFYIDGLIIEFNDLSIQDKLGRERNNNPAYARAFKSTKFEEVVEVRPKEIVWGVSKQGLIVPRVHFDPIIIDGVEVTFATGNNASWIKDRGIGVGSLIKICRSGQVIPKIIDVIEKVDFEYPDFDCDWDENKVHLVLNGTNREMEIKQTHAFFSILEVAEFGLPTVEKCYDNGFQDFYDILEMKKEDFLNLEGFGTKSATKLYNNIHSKMKDVQLAKLQHAVGIFKGLGSKKLELLEEFKTKPSILDVMLIDGFAETSASAYIDSYDAFFNDILPRLRKHITIKGKRQIERVSDALIGKQFVFTGVRSKEAEEKIKSMGGEIGSGVSKKTTHLVMKEVGSGSSKEKKALALGCEIITLEELNEML